MEKVLSLMSGLLAALSATALASSILFELGYFLAINIDLMRLASFSGYIRNALVWLPLAAAYILTLVALQIAIPKPNLFTNYLDRSFSDRGFNLALMIQHMRLLTLIVTLILILFLEVAWNGSLFALCISSAFLLIWMLSFWISLDLVRRHNTVILPFSVATIPIALGTILFLGWNSAFNMLVKDSVSAERIELEDGDVIRASILRAYDKGLLLKLPGTKTVKFYKWENVKSVSSDVTVESRRSIICLSTGSGC